ncbi:hypothetical protein NQ176_g4391 [Zarea fungicola]|uniref:Uncharacterized protein n=1 Tax=Zarea fungicola TaxID=93591 RepID=A0ACC1NFM4_9HYPO|nr:hypothetical protein NQ176_g4391 [Lecanicillium fungicola]
MAKPAMEEWETAAVEAADFTNVQRVDSKTYVVEISDSFNISAVPNGGYVAGQFAAVALAHVAEHGHTNVISAHWDFLGRSQPGRATLIVGEVKIARNMSVLYIAMYQDGQLEEAPWVAANAKSVIAGSVTCRSMESGPSYDVNWEPAFPPQPVDFDLLSRGQDPNWALQPRRPKRTYQHWDIYGPRHGPENLAFRDFWLKYSSGNSIKNLDLPYVCDLTPALAIQGFEFAHLPDGPKMLDFTSWYPTLNIHMDFKKNLPEEGVKWLRLRTTVKSVRDGRFDCDVDVFDVVGDMVAQARHMAMIVDVSRNTANLKPSSHL